VTEGGSHSFIFTDLVGFTALTAAEGDDRAAEVALEFYGVVRRLLADHCAEEIKAIGDALMLRCDDPALAVRLGLTIVRDLEARPAFPPVRVGLHTGPAVSRAGDWYGTTVNIAARLCSAAAGGEVLVSEETERAVGRVNGVAFGERRLHWLKNVTEPVAAHTAETPEPEPARRRWSALRAICPMHTRTEGVTT
jgi:adenylate cyclase